MGTAPVGRLLLEMSWPAILSMTINALYNVVDSIFVGHVSLSALTAVSYVQPLQMLMISLHVGSGVGVNSLISRRLGEGRYREAEQAAGTALRIAVLNFLIFFMVGAFLAKRLMSFYTSDREILDYSVSYFKIVTMLCIFNSIDFQIQKVLQATGNMVAPMIISMSGAITNIILDPIFIFGLFGVPRMEVAGAAIATVLGQFVAMCLSLYIGFRRNHVLKIQVRGFRIDWHVVKDIYAVGLPSIFMQSIGSFMLLGYNKILASEEVAVAVLGIYFKIQSFVFMPVFGMNQGAMPIMGYNYGAKNRKRLMRTYKLSLAAAFTIMFAGFLLFQFFAKYLIMLFNSDPEVIRIGIPALRRISLCFIPASFGIITSTLFQGTGHGLYSFFASLIRQLLGILPLAYFIFHKFGVMASWYAFPLAEILGMAYTVVMFIHLYRTDIRRLG